MRVERRFVDESLPVDEIKKHLVKFKKVKYYKDIDGNERTTMGKHFMSKKDIYTIVDLYYYMGVKKSMIKRKKYIHFSYNRIKKLTDKIDELKDQHDFMGD